MLNTHKSRNNFRNPAVVGIGSAHPTSPGLPSARQKGCCRRSGCRLGRGQWASRDRIVTVVVVVVIIMAAIIARILVIIESSRNNRESSLLIVATLLHS